MRFFAVGLLVVGISLVTVRAEEPAPVPSADKAVQECVLYLERVLALTKDAGEQAKLRAAIAALKTPPASAKPMNELVGDMRDNPAKFKGQTITLEARYLAGDRLTTLRDHTQACFEAKDPKGNVAVRFILNMPKDKQTIPAAVHEDKLVITFVCGNGEHGNYDRRNANEAVSIERPK